MEVSLESKQQPVEGKQGGVTLCQGELKGGKMDFLVEKCTELGVERFIPFSAGRSQGRLDDARLRQRQQRRMSIVKKACKQSGRLRFMRVEEEVNYGELLSLDFGSSDSKIILWEKAEGSTLAEAIGQDRESPVCLMIGPEGGFSDEEAEQALASGWQQASLGDQILRAETAAISAVAITTICWDECEGYLGKLLLKCGDTILLCPAMVCILDISTNMPAVKLSHVPRS